MKKFILEIKEKELVWSRLAVEVLAENKEDARNKMALLLENDGNPHEAVNTGDTSFIQDIKFVEIAEYIESDHKYLFENTNSDDIASVDERIRCEVDLSAFDIARYGNEELYNMAEEKFMKVGLNLEILEMEMLPIKIEEQIVTYDCVPTEYKHTFSDDDIWHMKDGVKLNLKGDQ